MPFPRNDAVFPELEIPAIVGDALSILTFAKAEFGFVIA